MSRRWHDRLEGRYRRLLRAYPAEYRRERVEEMLDTLLAGSRPGQTTPDLGEVRDLVLNGLRTRLRQARLGAPVPVAAPALHHAAMAMLAVATSAALAVAVAVGVYGYTAFYATDSYPIPVRIGLCLVMLTFPLALLAQVLGRFRLGRWLVAMGAAASLAGAAVLITHALHTGGSLEPSNLFGLTTLLCLPASLLVASRREEARRRRPTGRWLALTFGLSAPFLAVLALLEHALDEPTDPGLVAAGPPSLLDLGLTQGLAIALGLITVSQLLWATANRDDTRPVAALWATSVPLVGYAIGTTLTPLAFRPYLAATGNRWEQLPQNLLQMILVFTTMTIAAGWAAGRVRRGATVPPTGPSDRQA